MVTSSVVGIVGKGKGIGQTHRDCSKNNTIISIDKLV
jgi:hypothetical protein